MLFSVALQSLRNRSGAAWLTLLSITVSVVLLVSVEHLRLQAKESFSRTISGVDLIVGAPTGQTNLLLYTVFRMGNPTKGMSWQSYESLSQVSSVKWSVPISLGDSHKGFRVMGTNADYFAHYQYGNKQPLKIQEGTVFGSALQAVIGSDVAKELGYQVGSEIILSHGHGDVSFSHHQHVPFMVSGILAPTGTPVDKTVHVTLQGIELAHMPQLQAKRTIERALSGEPLDIEIKQISGIFLGLNSKVQSLQLQSAINQYKPEALMAILPGVALTELWQLVANLENLLLVVSAMILISSLLGLATMLLTSIRERRAEMAVLRAIGARPMVVFLLIQAEALLLTAVSCMLAVFLVWSGLGLSAHWLSHEFGLFIENTVIGVETLGIVAIVCAATSLIACIPAISAYRQSLQQGLAGR